MKKHIFYITYFTLLLFISTYYICGGIKLLYTIQEYKYRSIETKLDCIFEVEKVIATALDENGKYTQENLQRLSDNLKNQNKIVLDLLDKI